MTVKIFGWQADTAGCGYYRIKLPMDALREEYGMDVGYGMRFNRHAPPELLIGQRLGQPKTLALLHFLKETYGTRFIYEVDDDLFNVPGKNPSSAVFADSVIRKGMIDSIRLADAVTVSTPELASQIKEIAQVTDAPIYVLPNSLPGSAYHYRAGPGQSAGNGSPMGAPVILGWRGSATHAEDFAEARHGLGRIMGSHNVRLKLVGSAPAQSFSLPQEKIEQTGWITSMDQFYKELNFDIGIIPLTDNVFNASKSNIAVLEMAARGIPVIASDLPSYRSFIQHGVNGFLVKQKHEWAKYMKVLIEDTELRGQMALRAYQGALPFHSKLVAPAYQCAYRSVME